uniref:Uncharacterized protein n=1 Tax=Anopheles epiroticus TaxID=199890 RepID=A0A182PJM3_9DIPT
MAYLSDVDLAKLHKSRLEERVQYRLSAQWTNASELRSREQASLTAVSSASAMFGDRETAKLRQQQQYNFSGHVIRPRIRSSNSMSSSSSTASNYHHQQQQQHHASSSRGGKHVEWSDDDHLHDDGYFSSDTRRRRSGTWPEANANG